MPRERPVVLLSVQRDLVTQIFRPADLDLIAERADIHEVADPTALVDSVPSSILSQAEVVLTGWGSQQIDGQLLARMPKLNAVVHTGGSVRKIVTPETLEHGVMVSTQADANAVPVAEYTHAMVMLSLKGVFRAAQELYGQRKRIDVYSAYRVSHDRPRTVGVVGASRIGRAVIERLRQSGVDMLLYDPYCHESARLGVTQVGLTELFAQSDVVTLHAPGIEETQGMVSRELLALMRDGATLINTARGSIVDSAALEAELVRGRLRAVLDVTEPAELPSDSPLWELPNVLLTPHIAGAVGGELFALGAGATREVMRHLSGLPMEHVMTPEQYTRSA